MDLISVRPAIDNDLSLIIDFISRFELDSEDINVNSFIIAELEGVFAGFGRIKQYNSCHEIASIGVLEEYRGKGIGKAIVLALINAIPNNDIWLVTIKPDYFRKFGFVIANSPPQEIINKCERVCSSVGKTQDDSIYMLLRKNIFK